MAATGARADHRVALLIGNSAYVATAILQNPRNDVALMAETFRAAGFDSVDMVTDVDRRGMIDALRRFEDKATGADIAVIYYSGHGTEMEGQNYLIPVDARLATDRDVVDEAVTLERVQLALEGVKRLRLVILDACRNNPFETTMKRSLSIKAVSRGLSRVEPGTNSLVAFAAKAGTVADDGDGKTSPYATALASRLAEPGIDVQLAFRKVRDDVLEATAQRQEPFVYGSLGGASLALSKIVYAPPLPLAGGDDDAVWEAVKLAGDAQLVRDFILKYPRNSHREEAISLLTALQRPPPLPGEASVGAVAPAVTLPHPASPPPPPLGAVKAAVPSPAGNEPPTEPGKTAAPPRQATALAAPDDQATSPAKAVRTPELDVKPLVPRKKAKPAPAPARSTLNAPAPRVLTPRPAAPRAPAAPKKSFFFSCKLPNKNPVNSSYYGADAAVIRCVE